MCTIIYHLNSASQPSAEGSKADGPGEKNICHNITKDIFTIVCYIKSDKLGEIIQQVK
jgi:hypothetical protein